MRISWLLLVALVLSCGGSHSSNAACTPDGQRIQGTVLTFTPVDVSSSTQGFCNNRLLTSGADVANAFPNGDAPAQVANADFSVDRVFLAVSNPAVMFVVDDGSQLVVGQEQLCQGAAPQCTAHIIHATTKNSVRDLACPYTGPDPCLAP